MKKGFTLIELILVIAIVGVIGVAAVKGLTPSTNQPATTSKYDMALPESTGYVVDQAGVLTEETKTKVESTLKALDQTAQVAVVTVKTTQPWDEKQYAIKLAEKWKPGYKGKDNGVIFLIVTDDRKVRIEVGRGLESVITDSKAGQILDDSVVPFLKSNDWNGGVVAGVEAISKEVNK